MQEEISFRQPPCHSGHQARVGFGQPVGARGVDPQVGHAADPRRWQLEESAEGPYVPAYLPTRMLHS